MFSVVMQCALIGLAAGTGEPVRWPQFRGIEGRGIAGDARPLPVEFGPQQRVLWKTPLPCGFSSPCIWGERIFLTGYDAPPPSPPGGEGTGVRGKLETLCLDRGSGAILWRRTAPADSIEKVYKVNNPASSTPATDGRRLFVAFGSYGLLCYDFDGNELWKRPLPLPKTTFGSATSPVFVPARLTPLSHGERGREINRDLVLLNSQGKDLHLMAVDAGSGVTLWTTDGTPFPSDYPVPHLWQSGDTTEVIVPGRGGLLAYDLKDGSRRWWLSGLSREAASSPAQGNGLLFVASHLPGGDPDRRMTLPDFGELLKLHDKDRDGKLSRKEAPADLPIFDRGGTEGIGEIRLNQMYWLFDKNGDGGIDPQEWQQAKTSPYTNSLLAIRPGGKNDISGTHVAWQARRGAPEVPSPLYYQGRVYMIRNGGVLTCLDAVSGNEAFPQQRLPAGGIFYASPVAGDGKIYLASDAGVVMVLKAGPRFDLLAENDLRETIRATPALVDGKIYLRTEGHLYAFGE